MALDWINLPLMDPEQYLIADEACILDTSKAKRELATTELHYLQRRGHVARCIPGEYRLAKTRVGHAGAQIGDPERRGRFDAGAC
jgi:hypothetical protein